MFFPWFMALGPLSFQEHSPLAAGSAVLLVHCFVLRYERPPCIIGVGMLILNYNYFFDVTVERYFVLQFFAVRNIPASRR